MDPLFPLPRVFILYVVVVVDLAGVGVLVCAAFAGDAAGPRRSANSKEAFLYQRGLPLPKKASISETIGSLKMIVPKLYLSSHR